MMSKHVMVTPLFHQRSHSMPVGRAFIKNHGSSDANTADGNNRTYDFKRSSPLKNETSNTSDGFPLPITKSSLNNHRAANHTTTMSDQQEINNNAVGAAGGLSANGDIMTTSQSSEPNFFCSPKTILNLFDYNRKIANCSIVFKCKMDRGFFTSQSHWTCYRRNYFQVTASFIIPGHSDTTCYALQLDSDQPMQPIQQFFLRLKACTSSAINASSNEETVLENHNAIRPVALTQMTPKRDKGPQREPPMIPITPSDTVYGSEQACVTFERLQFRVATANNGKRRASQQFFRLIFELVAQLDDQSLHVVSECYSSPLVVRGRSPGHYSSENHNHAITPISTTSADVNIKSPKKKRKVTLVSPISPDTASPTEEPSSDASTKAENDAATKPVTNQISTLPPRQYVYGPPMVIDQQQQAPPTSATSTSSSYSMMPALMTPTSYSSHNSAFSNFHNRSQSANDTEFYARQQQRYKYYPTTNNQQQQHWDDSYDVGMARALRNWQQQVNHQRTDSAATYDSFDHTRSTRPGTPIPAAYGHPEGYHQWSNGSPQHPYDEEKLNQQRHDAKLYNNNN